MTRLRPALLPPHRRWPYRLAAHVLLAAALLGPVVARACGRGVLQIVLHLDKLVDKRGLTWNLQVLANALATTLRRALGVAERKL